MLKHKKTKRNFLYILQQIKSVPVYAVRILLNREDEYKSATQVKPDSSNCVGFKKNYCSLFYLF